MKQDDNNVEVFAWIPPQKPSSYMLGANVFTANLFTYQSGETFADSGSNKKWTTTIEPTTEPYKWMVSGKHGIFAGGIQFSQKLGILIKQRLTVFGSVQCEGTAKVRIFLSVQGQGEWTELRAGEFFVSKEFQLETKHQPLSCLVVVLGGAIGDQLSISIDRVGVVPAVIGEVTEATAVTTKNGEGEGFVTLEGVEINPETETEELPKPVKRKKK